MHKPRQRSSFIKAALRTLESIGALDQFLTKHKKDYVDLHRTTEQERDSIEHEVTVFVKACKEQIDILKTGISDEELNSKGWLGIKGDHSNADTIAHKHGVGAWEVARWGLVQHYFRRLTYSVVLILSERLHLVTSQFDQLRAIRFQEAINRATPRRKLKRVAASNSMDNSNANDLELKKLDNSEHREPDEVELTSLLDAVQETETKMVEMSALNHLMSTHVLQQAQQIELLYDQTLIFLPFYCGVMLMLNIFKALLTSIKHS
ncbi:syntaxin of plants 81 [Actinidia rufa]|uniref:Syntaxin of plants 81 n=1 Tax=Actinidia rufa TaxID=165716 RepID=A0A7J0ED64_9ERIC|nr:syntaxin of plants 81 [Actinidia rufa]